MTKPREARDSRGRYTRNPDTARRDAQAAELRAQGWTLQQIADELGYYDRSSVRQGIRRALRDIIEGPAQRLLQLHTERLETLYAAALEILEADHVMVSQGRVMKDDDGNPIPDPGPKLSAIREARATLESFRKLTGLDARQKVDVTGGVRYEIVGLVDEAPNG